MASAKARLAATLFTLILTCSLVSGATRQESITDPSLGNMTAFTVNIPANWHFERVLMQDGACVQVPFPVFRATSPDGLSFVKQMPVLGWIWSNGPGAKANHEGCVPLKEAMSAQDFLKYISATLNVEYLADEAVPADVNAKVQQGLANVRAIYAPKYAAMHMQQPDETRTLARAAVRYKNGSFSMKGRLATMVDCTTTHNPGVKTMLRGMADIPAYDYHLCTASVRFTSAPEDKYRATAAMLDAANMDPEGSQAWSQAWINRNNQQTAAAINRMNADAAAQRQASAQQFAHGQAVRRQQHDQFLATLQRGTDISMQRAAEVANSNHRMASDVVDYAFDQQTVRDPNTGQVSKVSSAYGNTWVDSTGKYSFQTTDVNANPNGTLQGNWTRQQVVHGDGSSR